MKTSTVNFTMTMPRDLKVQLATYSEKTGVVQGEAVRRLLEEFLEGRLKTNALPAVKP